MPSSLYSDSVDGEELNYVLHDDYYDSDEEITWDDYDEGGSDEYTDFGHPQRDLPLERVHTSAGSPALT
jgi:hypothetical protein